MNTHISAFRSGALAIAVAGSLVLGGCGADGPSPSVAGAPAVKQIVHVDGDHPTYPDLQALGGSADSVVIGTVLGISEDPGTSPGNDADGTPLPPIPHTLYQVEVGTSYAGPETAGQTLTVAVVGGDTPDATLVLDDGVPVDEGGTYLFFLKKGDDGRYYPLAGNAIGTESEAGAFVMSPSTTGLDDPLPLTEDQLESIGDSSAVVTNVVNPAVIGTPAVGEALAADVGSWSPADVEIGIQWLRDGNPIVGETGITYAILPTDLGHKLAIEVTGTSGGVSESARSAAVTVTVGAAPVATTAPTIGGTAKVGHSLTVTDGTWQPSFATISRQWLRDGQPIDGATGASYDLVTGDLGHLISVALTATAAGHADGHATTGAVEVTSGDAPANTAAPTITGGSTFGKTLHADPGAWDGQGLTFAYRWLRDGQAIPGAAGDSYVITDDDIGHDVTVEVTASSAAHDNGHAVSAPISITKAVPEFTAVPKRDEIAHHGKARISISLDVGDAYVPTGKVEIFQRNERLGARHMPSGRGDTSYVIRTRKLNRPGLHTLEVRYSGDGRTEAATVVVEVTVSD